MKEGKELLLRQPCEMQSGSTIILDRRKVFLLYLHNIPLALHFWIYGGFWSFTRRNWTRPCCKINDATIQQGNKHGRSTENFPLTR